MGISETLKAIADPVRRDILEMLKTEKKLLGKLQKNLISQGQQSRIIYHNKKSESHHREQIQKFYLLRIKHICI